MMSARPFQTLAEDQFGVVGDVEVVAEPVLVPVDGTADVVDPGAFVVVAPELVAPSVLIVASPDVVVPAPIVSVPVVPPIVPAVPVPLPPIVPVPPIVPLLPVVDVVESVVVVVEVLPERPFFIFLSALVDCVVVVSDEPAVCARAAVGTSSAAAAKERIMRMISSPRLQEIQRVDD